jgi:hypothetical protein
VLTYTEVLEQHNNPQISILMGNGFSQAWSTAIFNYRSLFDRARFGAREEIIRSIFNEIGTYDFEIICEQLRATERVLRAYGGGDEVLEQVIEDQECIKNALIEAIVATHPNRPMDVNRDQYIAARRFISPFCNIYTVNYDLLLHWLRNKYTLTPRDWRGTDGFNGIDWEGPPREQIVHHLHGAMHIYDSGSGIKKHRFTGTDVAIIDQVKENLANGDFPLFVSEPNSERKLKKIRHNPYLYSSYQSILNLRGTLVIFGHSMSVTDQHIFEQIKKSNITKIYISIYGDPDTAENQLIGINARTYLRKQGVDIDFFDAASAAVWG